MLRHDFPKVGRGGWCEGGSGACGRVSLYPELCWLKPEDSLSPEASSLFSVFRDHLLANTGRDCNFLFKKSLFKTVFIIVCMCV